MNWLIFPLSVTLAGLAFAWGWGGAPAAIVTALLAVMEVSLSFDNAVVNASVLKGMSETWRRRFMFWGIIIAVLGARLFLPALIVALCSHINIIDVAMMAFARPGEYTKHVADAHDKIMAFGGMFLFMVFTGYHCDKDKDCHWLPLIEVPLSFLGRIPFFDFVGGFLMAMLIYIGDDQVGMAPFWGAAVYYLLNSFHVEFRHLPSGLSGFLYLEALDASFSLDGVVGAFAMSNDVVVIMIGLGIGAAFIRSMTVAMVRGRTLEKYVYLEHGAHWGIGALAALMMTDIFLPVPQLATGLAGVGLIILSFLSSVKESRV